MTAVAMAIADIREILEDFRGLSPLELRVLDAVRTGNRFHDAGAAAELSRLRFPIHFLDFGTFGPPLRLYPGTRPYQTIPSSGPIRSLPAKAKSSTGSFSTKGGIIHGADSPRRSLKPKKGKDRSSSTRRSGSLSCARLSGRTAKRDTEAMLRVVQGSTMRVLNSF